METKTYKLDSLCEITSSKRIFYSEYTESGIPFFRSKEIIDLFNKNNIATELFISKDRYNEIKNKFGVPEKDDMLLTSVGSIGIPYLVKSSDKFYFKDGNLTWFRNYNRKLIVPLYLYLWTTSSVGKETLMRLSMGAAQPALTISRLKNLSLNLPSVSVQQKIASILSTYDRLIENNTRRIRLLEQMAENLYKEWFVRFRFPEHEKVEMVNGLPKRWETIHIKELAQLKSGYAFKSEWFVEEGEAVAKIKDIGNILMDTSSFSYVDKENCFKAKKFLLTTGDLTIALTGATIGKISIVPKHKGNIYTNQRLGKFFLGDKPIEKLPFLYCLFKQESMVSNIVNLSNSSSAQPNISPEQIEKIKILGNHDIISMYNKTCNPLFSNILALYSQNQLLTRQRDLLLPRLMSGKLEVKS
jgi:type I restriction modification DNA specificity domain protein